MKYSVHSYDYFIVGAGIAGLHCAERLRATYPTARIAIAEAYSSPGGRVVSYSPPNSSIRWEAGAGRFHSSHTLVLQLIKRYSLSPIPLDPETIWRPLGGGVPSPNTWDSFAYILVNVLSVLESSTLSTHTIEQLLHKAIGEEETKNLLDHFPYRSEVTVMRADVALESFRRELGRSANFMVVKEGLGELIRRMYERIQASGTNVFVKHRLIRVKPTQQGDTLLYFQNGSVFHAKHTLLTLPRDSLVGVHPFANLPALRHIKSSPLMRTYGVFSQPHWYAGLKKTVTNSPLRYVIPTGDSIMISYTDGDDTRPWKKILDKDGEKALSHEVVKEAKKVFPELSIPNPMFFKTHYWPDGAYYWAPGMYDPAAISISVLRPLSKQFPRLYVAGEAYSLRQAWMEGALEHAEELLTRFLL